MTTEVYNPILSQKKAGDFSSAFAKSLSANLLYSLTVFVSFNVDLYNSKKTIQFYGELL